MTLIFHFITTIDRGGAEAAVLQLAKQQVIWGHTVCVVPLKGNSELWKRFSDNGVTVNFDFINVAFIRQLRRARQLTKRHKNAIFHAHLPRCELLLSLIGKNLDLIITRHNSEYFLPPRFSKFSPIISRWVLRRARAVIAISSATKFFLQSENEVDSAQEVEIVYYGYDPIFAKPNTILMSTETHRSPLSILTIGRLTKQKNLHFALEVMSALESSHLNFHFYIIGEGHQRSELETKTAELGLQDRVTFFGKTSEIFKFMANAQVFLMTSSYEGFGLVNLEAMDYGLPIVAPFTSTFPEILGRDHPLLFEPNSISSCVKKLTKLLHYSPAQIEELQVRQRFLMTQFSVQKNLERHNEIYSKVKNN